MTDIQDRPDVLFEDPEVLEQTCEDCGDWLEPGDHDVCRECEEIYLEQEGEL